MVAAMAAPFLPYLYYWSATDAEVNRALPGDKFVPWLRLVRYCQNIVIIRYGTKETRDKQKSKNGKAF